MTNTALGDHRSLPFLLVDALVLRRVVVIVVVGEGREAVGPRARRVDAEPRAVARPARAVSVQGAAPVEQLRLRGQDGAQRGAARARVQVHAEAIAGALRLIIECQQWG